MGQLGAGRMAGTNQVVLRLIKIPKRLQTPGFIAGTYDDVIQDLDLEQLSSPDQIPRNFNVGITGSRVAARMVVNEHDAASGRYNDWPEHGERHDRTGIKASQRYQIMADDAFADIEHQDDERFLHRVIPVSFRDVLPPILRDLIRFRQQLGHGLAFPDALHFEFMGNVWSHRN